MLEAAKAVAQLESANRRLLEWSSFDAGEIESALAKRDEAVRAISTADAGSLEGPSAERLLRAFEDGRRIREKLAVFYRTTDGQLRRLERMLAGDTGPPASPNVSAIG
jgi:hypothetical protein